MGQGAPRKTAPELFVSSRILTKGARDEEARLPTQDDHDLPTGPFEAAAPDCRSVLAGLVANGAAGTLELG